MRLPRLRSVLAALLANPFRHRVIVRSPRLAQCPCCAFGERLPTSCRRQIGQIERRRAGAAFSAKKIMRSSEICARIIALSHYRIMRYAQNAATRITLLRAKRCGGKDASKRAAKVLAGNCAVLSK